MRRESRAKKRKKRKKRKERRIVHRSSTIVYYPFRNQLISGQLPRRQPLLAVGMMTAPLSMPIGTGETPDLYT
ncbi:hypothetical protein CALCODRAFT_491897 [Calocera cornea HHB12733]|uniref:Uncharacterized protein n=1 Tax=Calocera cornea HHB12733 TaxID=1353952 RepID=A0A165ITD6_9BASI|nr:hypothetical protein CALCODRAFT_491897 [Calocera cornea HHB12733]